MVQYSNFDRVMGTRDHFKNRASSKSLMVGILLLFLAVCAFGQTTSISREQMIQDIDILFSTIEEVHPDMYSIYPKQQLDKDIERVKSQLEPSGDILYFYKQVAPLVVKLGDGHTDVYPPYYRPDIMETITFFPFNVKVTYPDKEILVQEDYTQTIPIGAQITSINNRQKNDIIREMMNYASGEKKFYRVYRVENLFVLLMPILYRDNVFDIEYVFNQKKHSVQVNGISFKEISEKLSQQNNPMSRNKYTFSTLPDKNIGIIEFNQFNDMDRFKVFLDSTFQVLQKENIENLIIDLRKNGGGNSGLGDELFQYVSHVPFRQYGKMIVKYSDIQKQHDKTFYNVEYTNPNGIEINNVNAELIELRENPLRYKGNVFVLISHRTFSAATDFAWAFQYFKMGTVVGEETGGMVVSFGNLIRQNLPNSGILYSISYKKFYNYGTTDDNLHGVIPDYHIEAEKALDFTIDLITRGK